MNVSRRLLCGLYAAIALVALVGTWGNNLAYLDLGPTGGTLHFWQETLSTPASRSITVDIFFFGLAVSVWMVMEARRLQIKGVWLYIMFGMLIATSVTFPIFMISRERAIAAAHADQSFGGSLSRTDVAGLALFTIAFLAYTVVTFTR